MDWRFRQRISSFDKVTNYDRDRYPNTPLVFELFPLIVGLALLMLLVLSKPDHQENKPHPTAITRAPSPAIEHLHPRSQSPASPSHKRPHFAR